MNRRQERGTIKSENADPHTGGFKNAKKGLNLLIVVRFFNELDRVRIHNGTSFDAVGTEWM